MKRAKLISSLTLVVAIMMLSVGIALQSKDDYSLTTGKIEEFAIKDIAASAISVKDNKIEEKKIEKTSIDKINMETAPAAYIKIEKAFNEISLEEAIASLQDGTLRMEYSARYTDGGLTKRRGAIFYNGHRETYYSEKVLPGNGLRIPGRHVADDGTIRDADGYICVAADPAFMPKGSTLITSLGPAKVYDCGCAYGTIDIYVSW